MANTHRHPAYKRHRYPQEVIADADGLAEFSVEMDAVPSSTERSFLSVAVAYHSDGQTYGHSPGEFGKNVHVGMYYDFLPADS